MDRRPEESSSESALTAEQHQYIDKLAAVFLDPVAHDVLKEADSRERQLQYNIDAGTFEEDGAEAERNQNVKELNAMWPYLNKAVKISGNLQEFDQHTQEFHNKYLESEQVFVSRGIKFFPVALTRDTEDSHRLQPVLHLEQVTDTGIKRYIADPSQITVDSLEMSYKRAKAVLETLYGERFDAINTALEQADKTDSSRVRSLAEVTIPFDLTNTSLAFEVKATETYIDDKLNLETVLPYTITIDKTMHRHRDRRSFSTITLRKSRRELVHVQGVEYMRDIAQQGDDENDAARLIPTLRVESYGGDRNQHPETYLMPFASIVSLDSLRCLARGYNGEPKTL